MGSNLPDVSVTGLEFHRTTKYLVASTYGRGLFAAYLHFTTDVAPAGATVANVVFNFAKDLDGRICVNQAEFGHAFSGWFEVQGNGRTDAAPAAAAVGNHLFVAGKSPRREQLDRLNALEAAYAELREETIHVPSLRRAVERARDIGVVWDPQIFSILDNVAAKTPTTWTRQLIYT